MTDRIEVQRAISAPASDVFAVLCDPQGHVAVDSSGMLQSADGEIVYVGKSKRVRTEFEPDALIAWTVTGQLEPQIGHVYGYRLAPDPESGGTLVTSFYDWSDIHQTWRDAGIFPILSEPVLRATLGILDRTVHRGYPRG